MPSPAPKQARRERFREARFFFREKALDPRSGADPRPALHARFFASQTCAILSLVGCVCVPLGAACVAADRSVVETGARYDDACAEGFFATDAEAACRAQTFGEGTACEVTLVAPRTMRAPVFVYYELTNFHQNHRRFVKSRSDEQLAGETSAPGAFCAPQARREAEGETRAIDPCGLAAWSYFNDTYSFEVSSDATSPPSPLPVNERGIAWPSDLEHKFADKPPRFHNDDPATRGGGAVDGTLRTDEHFVVWMRTAAMSTFRKLWGRVEEDIAKGAVVTVRVTNRFNSYKYGGEKRIVLSTASWLGGKNAFLGTAYLVVGSLCFGAAGVFAYFAMYPPRTLGDVAELMSTARQD